MLGEWQEDGDFVRRSAHFGRPGDEGLAKAILFRSNGHPSVQLVRPGTASLVLVHANLSSPRPVRT
eukprot:scaffold198540_cov29-Tisochrysis_lutea.AAC.6